MAYTVKKNFRKEYNVDYAVGAGAHASNHPIDVMLVQMLLRILHVDFGGKLGDYGEGEIAPPAQYPEPSAVDGKIGPITIAYIRNWQAFLGRKGMVIQDGVLTPVRYGQNGMAENFTTSRSFYRPALYMLNATLQQPTHEKQYVFDTLSDDHRTDVPLELRKALKTPKLTADRYR